jgi:peptidoglycan/LPS O-acetylase OafA/YrhL
MGHPRAIPGDPAACGVNFRTPHRPGARDTRPGSTVPRDSLLMKDYLPTLDGWRAVAIAGVMVYHGTTSLFYPYGPLPSYKALVIIQSGAVGVDIFFALSGFLICNRLLNEWNGTSTISLKQFYIRRSFRILPAYFFYLFVLAIIVSAGFLAAEGREFMACSLFLRNYIGPKDSHGWYTGHFWSLSVEEHFYLLWPALLLLCGPRRARWLVVVLGCSVGAWRALDERFHWVPLPRNIGNRTDTRIDALLWGCWAAMLFDRPACKKWLERWLSFWVWLALLGVLCLCYRYRNPLSDLLMPLLMPFLLVGTVLHPTGPLGRILEMGSLRWVGRMSYSLYLWQQIFLLGSWRALRPFPLGYLQELPVSIVAAVVCASLSYYLVERPMIGVGRRLIASLGRPPASRPVLDCAGCQVPAKA